MRILQLVTRNELRGAEVFAGQLSDELARRGHQVIQAALYRRPETGSEPLNFEAADHEELLGKVKGRIEIPVLLRLGRLLRRFRPEIVQANGFHGLKYAVLQKHLQRHRFSIVYRNIGLASDWVAARWKLRWGQWLARSIEAVVSVSDASRRDFCRLYGVPESRAFTVRRGVWIPNPTDVEKNRPLLRELIGATENEQIVLHVGGMTPEKNHLGLIDAFSELHESAPQVRLVCCGDGPLREEVAKRVNQRGLQKHVLLLGNRQDARELMCGADLLVLCSLTEGMPGVVLEAGARRLPVVSTSVGGVSELIENGVSGFLIEPGDVPQLELAIKSGLKPGHEQQRLATELHHRVKSRFNFADSVDHFERIYANSAVPVAGE